MSAGQRAMALAMLYPEAKRGVHSQFRGGTGEVSKERLSKARAVLRVAPDVASLVTEEQLKLPEAWSLHEQRKADAEIRHNTALAERR